MTRLLTPRELAELVPAPERPLTELEAARLLRMYAPEESDRVPPPRSLDGLAEVIPFPRALSDEEIDRLLSEPPPDDDEPPPRPWPPPRRPKKAS